MLNRKFTFCGTESKKMYFSKIVAHEFKTKSKLIHTKKFINFLILIMNY